MLFREINAIYFENYTNIINTVTLCGQNAGLLNFKASGKCSYHQALKGLKYIFSIHINLCYIHCDTRRVPGEI
jgi:hypothetical protein